MELTKEVIEQTKNIETPFLFMDLDILKNKYKTMKETLGDIEIYYAIKANSDINALKTLIKLGSKFETASYNEIDLLIRLGVDPKNIINSAPFRKETDMKKMYDAGIRLFCYDTITEAEKFARTAPEARLFLRIHVQNQGSDWPMPKKFGAEPSDAVRIIKKTRSMGLNVIGITFHPGSQCLNVSNWIDSLMLAKSIYDNCKKQGIELSMINLGGGVPIKHIKDIPTVKDIADTIHEFVNNNFSPVPKLMIEPGRGMIGDSAIMVAQVISKRKFKEETWIYLDIGMFHGLMETMCDFDYLILTESDINNSNNCNGDMCNCKAKEKREKYVIAGQTCDGVDIMFKSKKMSKVNIGDRVYIINTGAYTLSYASLFNGFKIPLTYYYRHPGEEQIEPCSIVETFYQVKIKK